jgi:ribonuclease D
MAASLSRHHRVAVDTESNSLFAYREQVCLIQFSTPAVDYLVDPFALPDLSPIEAIFADPGIEKIFHAAEYDLICLKRDFGFRFANLFDTMVACRTLGRSAVGLAAVLEEEFGLQLDKHYQRANWGARPLPASLLAYARLDTHYLLPLRERLRPALAEQERLELAEEDFRRLCEAPVQPLETENCHWWRVASGQELTPQQAAVLSELCHYRDQRARQVDLPVFKVLSDRALVEVALACPATPAELQQKTTLRGKLFDRHAEGLLHAVRHGLRAQPPRRPAQARPDERYLRRLDRLKRWRKQTGEAWGVDSDVILPRDVMEALAQTAPRREEDLASVMASVPWRRARFGTDLLKIIN